MLNCHKTDSTTTVATITTDELVTITVTADGDNKVNNIPFLPDTGAEIDAIPTKMYRRMFQSVKLVAGTKSETATGAPIISKGVFRATLRWKNCENEVGTKIHVLDDLQQPVLSKSTQRKFGMIPAGYPHEKADYSNKAEHLDHRPISEVFRNILAISTPATQITNGVSHPSPEEKQKDIQKIMGEFPNIVDGRCRAMRGPPCHFELQEGAKPVSMRGSRPVAVPLMPRLKEELENLEKEGIIQKVSKPTAWVHPIVLVPKKNGSIRLCVDFRELNKCIIRPIFETATPFQAVRTIPTGMKYFTVVDALKGYHQIPIDKKSTDLTTFSTPFGRFQYLRLPFGVIHAGDTYCRRVSDIFDDIPGSRRIVEDIIIFSKTYEEHLELVRTLFARASEYDVSLNTSKIVFAQEVVQFGGYLVDTNGFSPGPRVDGSHTGISDPGKRYRCSSILRPMPTNRQFHR